jgi:hypothetical protein
MVAAGRVAVVTITLGSPMKFTIKLPVVMVTVLCDAPNAGLGYVTVRVAVPVVVMW